MRVAFNMVDIIPHFRMEERKQVWLTEIQHFSQLLLVISKHHGFFKDSQTQDYQPPVCRPPLHAPSSNPAAEGFSPKSLMARSCASPYQGLRWKTEASKVVTRELTGSDVQAEGKDWRSSKEQKPGSAFSFPFCTRWWDTLQWVLYTLGCRTAELT